jgi:AAA+ superfamily predicted ATPase
MFHVKKFLLIALLISSCSTRSMNKDTRRYIPTTPLFVPVSEPLCTNRSDMETEEIPPVIEHAIQDEFDAKDIDEMNYVFQNAPRQAQMIVEHLKDPTYLDDIEYRSATFVGEPGSGKTTMALAIAHRMSEFDWKYALVSSTALLGQYRNQTALHLGKLLRAIAKSIKPTILIIDELNRLLEHSESKSHDTDTTATTLWTFLDQQRKNVKFFFIGTMNNLAKLPKPYKDRILFEYIKFDLITSPAKKCKALLRYLNGNSIRIDPTVTREFLMTQLGTIGDCSGRNLKKLAAYIRRLSRLTEQERSGTMVITMQHIAQAIAEYSKRKDYTHYDAQELTDEQRQDKYHKDTMYMQEKHFLQQHLKQAIMLGYGSTGGYNGQHWSTSRQYLESEGIKRIDELFSDDQQAILDQLQYKSVMRFWDECVEAERAKREAAEKAKQASLLNYLTSFLSFFWKF